MKGPLDLARGLVAKAEKDLIAAEATLATARVLDTVYLHAQQAVEKSLKALLALDDVEYPRRHDLGELVALVKERVREIRALEVEMVGLAPYEAAVRYDEAFAPDLAEAQAALEIACEVYGIGVGLVGKKKGT